MIGDDDAIPMFGFRQRYTFKHTYNRIYRDIEISVDTATMIMMKKNSINSVNCL